MISKSIKQSVFAAGLSVVVIAMSGCAISTAHKAEKKVYSDERNVSEKIKQGNKFKTSSTSPAVVDGLYIAGKSYKMSDKDRLPSFFSNVVTMNKTDPMNFSEIVNHIAFDFGIKISLSADAQRFLSGDSGSSESSMAAGGDELAFIMNSDGAGFPGTSMKYSMAHFKGSISGLLDSVTSKANLFWKWDGEQVVISRLETVTYVFDGDAQSDSFESSITTGRSGSGGGGESATQDNSQSSQTTKTSRKASDAFEDMKLALSAMVSSEGKFSVSPQPGLITVTDTPVVHNKVSAYIDQLNNIVNKRINVRTEVYEITSDDNGNFNIDWNAIYAGSSRYGLELLNTSASDVAPNVSLGIISGENRWNGTKAFISSLNEIVDMSLSTSSTNYTTNGKTVPVQIADEVRFIENISKTTNEEGDTFSTETASLLSGYTMNLTPRINSNGDIDLQFAVDLSQVKDIETINFGGGNIVQLPSRTFKSFQQRVSVDSGSTIMIAGFERTVSSSKTSSVHGKPFWFLGGNRGGGKQKIMTLILITPYIMAR